MSFKMQTIKVVRFFTVYLLISCTTVFATTISCKDVFLGFSSSESERQTLSLSQIETGDIDRTRLQVELDQYRDRARQRYESIEYKEILKTLIGSSLRPFDTLVQLSLGTDQLPGSQKPLSWGSFLEGRIIHVNEGYIDPLITMMTENGQRVEFYLSDIQLNSVTIMNRALTRPQLPKGLKRPSEIAKFDDVNYVIHATNLYFFKDIFSSGILKKPEVKNTEIGHHGVAAVYLSAKGRNVRGTQFRQVNIRAAAKWKIVLVFDPQILDEGGYHISREWPYGELTADSALPNQTQKLHEIMWDLSNGFQDGNEIVFSHSISLKQLKAIWVDREDRDEVIQILKSIDYKPPNGLTIEKFVVVQEVWP